MKFLSVFLALLLCKPAALYAAGLDDLKWTITDGEVTIISCDEAATGELAIPDTIEGNPVTSIGDEAFSFCGSLTDITIPKGLNRIGRAVFSNCSNLTSITIPYGVTSIGDNAFLDCLSLPEITIPESVTSIGGGSFFNCFSLARITFEGVAPTVGIDAFSGVAFGAVAIVSPDALESFSAGIDDWNGLTVETLLTWTTTNNEVTITDCDAAAAGGLIIPDTIDGNPVTSIGNEAFWLCQSLTSITMPDSITSIGNCAFRDCSSLTSITIPDEVTSIEYCTFDGCHSLTDVTIPGTVTTIGSRAFNLCRSLTRITIPDGVTSIGDYAFDRCGSLTSITIPDRVTSIGEGTFEGCHKLTEILVASENASYADINGVLFNSERTVLLKYPEGKTDGSYRIPDGVTGIWHRAFVDSDNLNSVTIPDSITNIGIFAFGACSSLTRITFEGTAPTVGEAAFRFLPDDVIAIVPREHVGSYTPTFLWNGITTTTPDELDIVAQLEARLAAVTAERDDAIAERDARPTQAAYDAVVTERDARYTEDQIHALSADYTIGLDEAGNVEMKFNLFESSDLITFAPFTVNPESVSVVDGSICLEFAPTDDAAFFRFSVE